MLAQLASRGFSRVFRTKNTIPAMFRGMKRTLLGAGLLIAAASLAVPQRTSSPPLAKNEAEKKVLAVLDGIVKSHHTYLSVPMQDGRALRLLAESSGAKNVVEIGTSTGYSGLWFCLALQTTGGHLTTFELDQARASMARGHFKEAGVDNLVTIVEGDAHQNVVKLKGPVDLAFIDADKDGYIDYLNKVLPLVRPGGLILAHNVEMVPDYVRAVTTSPDLETIFYMEGGGLAVTLKKR
jgi:predicted O-methyltransferase YrrM